MNILFLSTENPYPIDHGHHLRTYYILKYLAKENKIFFIGFAKNRKELSYKDQLEKICHSVHIFLLPEGKLRWRFLLSLLLNLFSFDPFIANRYYLKQARLKIKEILQENQIHLVHFDILHVAKYHKVVTNVPKVLANHNVESLRVRRWLSHEGNILAKCYLYMQYLKIRHFEKVVCAKFDKCIVVSEYDRRKLEEISGVKGLAVIPNGVDTQYFHAKNGKLNGARSLVWVGGMEDAYNKDAVDYFLDDILPHILKQNEDLEIVFVGKSPTRKLVRKSKDNKKIRFTGFVEDVRPYVEKAAIFIAPIRSGSGTKLKILNAMSQGKAVVTTSIGAEGIEAVANESLIIEDDPIKFAIRIKNLLDNIAYAESVGLSARKVMEEKYDWRIINKKIQRIYGNVMKDNH